MKGVSGPSGFSFSMGQVVEGAVPVCGETRTFMTADYYCLSCHMAQGHLLSKPKQHRSHEAHSRRWKYIRNVYEISVCSEICNILAML